MKYNFTPTAGLRNHQFEDVEDICDMKTIMEGIASTFKNKEK